MKPKRSSRDRRGLPSRSRRSPSPILARTRRFGCSPAATHPTSSSTRWAAPKTYEQAFYARDLAGAVVLAGAPTPDTRTGLPLLEVFGRSGALKSSWYGDCLPSRDFPKFIDLYLQGRLDLGRFVSEEITLNDVEETLAKMNRGEVLRSVVVF